jgi:hypothetical protein
MNLFSWLVGGQSVRQVALSLYKQGLAQAKLHDFEGAMQSYTAAIEAPHAPEDVRAMALCNRALMFGNDGKTANAAADLNAVLAMAGSLRVIKAAARNRLVRLNRQHEREIAARPSVG